MRREKEIEREIKKLAMFQYDLIEELIELAGLSEEWKQANPETFESIINKATEILEVDIF